MTRRAALALASLAAILVVTVAWWLLALWPPSAALPDWVERTRAVCFGVAPSGLPHAGGWVLLIGEPLGMIGFLMLVWGDALREGLRALWRARVGRVLMIASVMALAHGLGVASVRVRTAAAATRPPALESDAGTADPALGAVREVDAPAPAMRLVDQHGDTVSLDRFAGRPVLAVFAYGHCETVCPLIVEQARRAVESVTTAGAVRPVLVVITLDPWRDTPSRLPHVAASWRLPADAHLLGGSVEDVERVLSAWDVGRTRDARTGEIVHGTSAHLVDGRGRLRWVVPAGSPRLAELLATLGD